MKLIIGLMLIIGGIILGLYVGVWLMFIGGITKLIEIGVNIYKGGAVEAMAIALNLARVFCAGLVGWLCAIVFIIPGVTLLND